MSLRKVFKRAAEHIPAIVGRPLSRIPFSWRLGRAYEEAQERLANRAFIDPLTQLKLEVDYAYENVPFYRELYERQGFHPSMLQSVEDFDHMPIVTKRDLKGCPIHQRSARVPGRMRINTGGTSGQPLHFYLDRHAFAREWAHMHEIWAKLGYHPRCCKLTFRGKNLGGRLIRYNAVHNEFIVNAYAPAHRTIEAIHEICRHQTIEFLHGYPSSIALFARACADQSPRLADLLRKSLKGILFGSEFPAPQYRELAERAFNVPSISWYGHSEMAILAYEVERYVYEPFQSYGYCQAAPDGAGRYHLLGTSFHNTASPFIRYDTEDLIVPEFRGSRLKRFQVDAGRVGDFVTDANGTQISLTSLIFGRHHHAFEWASFVQVRQEHPGEATVLVTVPSGNGSHELKRAFDFDGVAMRFRYELRNEPVRTRAGKVPLLVN